MIMYAYIIESKHTLMEAKYVRCLEQHWRFDPSDAIVVTPTVCHERAEIMREKK